MKYVAKLVFCFLFLVQVIVCLPAVPGRNRQKLFKTTLNEGKHDTAAVPGRIRQKLFKTIMDMGNHDTAASKTTIDEGSRDTAEGKNINVQLSNVWDLVNLAPNNDKRSDNEALLFKRLSNLEQAANSNKKTISETMKNILEIQNYLQNQSSNEGKHASI